VDAREHEFRSAERWSDENVFANRAYFMPDKQPAELGVDNIRKDDAGIYRCRVDFKVAQTRNSKVNLTVIEIEPTPSFNKSNNLTAISGENSWEEDCGMCN
ncbi:hypothetical protein L9F63_003539, partial [Diploptera punctata]